MKLVLHRLYGLYLHRLVAAREESLRLLATDSSKSSIITMYHHDGNLQTRLRPVLLLTTQQGRRDQIRESIEPIFDAKASAAGGGISTQTTRRAHLCPVLRNAAYLK